MEPYMQTQSQKLCY